jgi:uncharacterized delta-60 repeat protein
MKVIRNLTYGFRTVGLRALSTMAMALWLAVSVFGLAPGDLDPTFSGDGLLIDYINGVGADFYTARAVAIQPDGKILIGGAAGTYLALARYNTDGSPDSSFGTEGKVTTIVDDYFEIQAIAVQTDGKIVAVACNPNAAFNYFIVLRYYPDGSLETVWGDSMGEGGNLAVAIAIQLDGGVLVAGSLSHQHSVLFRYRSNGSRDTSFGTGGKVVTAIGRANWTSSIVVQPDGKIVAAGSSIDSTDISVFALVRYMKDGSLDGTFGSNGIVRTKFESTGPNRAVVANSLSLRRDGTIVAAGRITTASGETEFALARYKSNGYLDSTFDSDGKVTTPVYGSEATSVAVQSDGKVLAAGSPTDYTGQHDFYLVRYSANGSLDTTFGGGDGIAEADFEQGSVDVAYGMALDNAGKAVIAGISYQINWMYGRFAIARFILGPRLDPIDAD